MENVSWDTNCQDWQEIGNVNSPISVTEIVLK